MKKSTLWLIVLVLTVCVMSQTAFAQPLPRVNVMPGNETGFVYPYTWPGRTLTIWGNVHDGTPPYTYEWNFGDGSPTVSGSVTNPKYIAVTHTYATMGPKYATLTVTDANSLSDQDVVEIEVAPIDFHVEVNAAIEDGLRFLYLQQLANGRWDYGAYDASTTAMAVLTFEDNRHLPTDDYDEDIYAEYVQAGLDFLFTTFYSTSVPVQGAGDPEEAAPGNTDHNGIGIGVSSGRNCYETGMAMMAIVGSGPLGSPAPDLVATTGPANVIGRTYRDIVIDMVDWCAWAQVEPNRGIHRGGWRYTPNYSSSDNSVAQWPAIGLEAAETNWGIAAPSFVKSELLLWLSASQISGGFYDGAFWYQPNWWPYSPIGVTGAGLCELCYADVPNNDPRVTRTINYLARDWDHSQNINNRYNLYAVAKGCRIAMDNLGNSSEIVSIDGIDWYVDYATNLMAIQQSDGGWPDQWGRNMSSAWAILVLSPTVVGLQPVAMSDGPSSVPPDYLFDLDGSSSYHMDPDKDIVAWLWDFDNSDGVDWTNPDAIGIIASDVSYSLPGGVLSDTFVVTLRVADNSDPVMTDIAEHAIIVNFDNHPPLADAGGPYSAKVGALITFDGTGSHDPDEPTGDYIVSYSWDIDGDGVFGDCTDSVCQESWAYEYSGYVGLVVTDTYGATSDTSQAYVTIWTSGIDVGMAPEDISFSKRAPQPGDNITITAVIRCDTASDPVADILVRFYDGDPDIAIHQIDGDQIIPAMVAGDAVSVEVPYVVGDTLPREIYVRVDPRDDIEEYNEDNNEAFKEIPAVLPVAIDIKPQSCPNPLNVKAQKLYEFADEAEYSVLSRRDIESVRGVLPAAILGTVDFDVMDIDPATVMLEGVAVLRSNIEDVSVPMDEAAEECECTTEGPDGFDDLTLKFEKKAVIEALGEVHDGEIIPLTITGELYDGTPIMGVDCVVIRGDYTPEEPPDTAEGLYLAAVLGNYPNPFNASTVISYTLREGGSVKLEVYDVLGRRTKTLVDGLQVAGRHEVIWDGTDQHGRPVGSGIYFYRLIAGDRAQFKKMVLMK